MLKLVDRVTEKGSAARSAGSAKSLLQALLDYIAWLLLSKSTANSFEMLLEGTTEESKLIVCLHLEKGTT